MISLPTTGIARLCPAFFRRLVREWERMRGRATFRERENVKYDMMRRIEAPNMENKIFWVTELWVELDRIHRRVYFVPR